MKHDESALVKQALRDAREQLARTGSVLPSAYMLVSNNPQTGALLTHPTAVGTQREQPFSSRDDQLAFLAALRTEAARLKAIAVAFAAEAQAEVESGQGIVHKRVLYVRVEDQHGVHQLHAPIERGSAGAALGSLVQDSGALDDIQERLLPMSSAGR
jgi:hypothetical protein